MLQHRSHEVTTDATIRLLSIPFRASRGKGIAMRTCSASWVALTAQRVQWRFSCALFHMHALRGRCHVSLRMAGFVLRVLVLTRCMLAACRHSLGSRN